MTIRTAVLCDTCDAVFVAEKNTPRGLLTVQAHQAGWTSIGKNGTWKNYCDDCSPSTETENAL